jgi:hypothetical protein
MSLILPYNLEYNYFYDVPEVRQLIASISMWRPSFNRTVEKSIWDLWWPRWYWDKLLDSSHTIACYLNNCTQQWHGAYGAHGLSWPQSLVPKQVKYTSLMSDTLSCFLQKEAAIETKYVGTINTLHVVISSKNKQKQRVTAFKTMAGQMKPPHTLLTWGGGSCLNL